MSRREEALAALAEVSGVDAREIAPDMDLVADLGIDSPKALRLLVALEDRFDVEIDDEDATRMRTVGDILAFAERL